MADAVILPGLVNTHTHLELSVVSEPVTAPSFFDWIQNVRGVKEDLDAEALERGAVSGLNECWRNGVTTIADTGDTGAVARVLARFNASGVVYQEVFGPHPDQVSESMAMLETAVGHLEGARGARTTIGVSPHAPYSVSGPLYSAVKTFAGNTFPVAMHLAESTAETSLVTRHTGAFAEMWDRRGIPPLVPARSAVAHVARTGILDTAPLVIHAVQVDAGDARLLRDSGATIATCPRSNRAHGHGNPPVTRWQDAGVRFGVGTDSSMSVGRLDLFAEVLALRQLTELSPTRCLEVLTIEGAHAIGLQREVGSLEEGKFADLLFADRGEDRIDPVEEVLAAGSSGILRTILGGVCVYARDTADRS